MMGTKRLLISLVLMLAFFGASCADKTKVKDAEERLLKVFQTELHDLEQFEDSTYVAYMDFQIKSFTKKQKLAVKLINQINKNFEALPEKKQDAYQREWAKKFQPVVNEIYDRTRALIISQTGNLSQETMAKIQELSDRMMALEKEAPAPKLKPTFFVTPTIPTGAPKSASP